jgi:hypothetical protein
MASSLMQIIWPEKFKPGHIDKYDGSSNPKEFIQVYHTVIEAEGGDDQVNANYLPTVLFDTRPEPGLSICPKDSSTTGTNYVLYSSGTFGVRTSRTFSSPYAYVRTFSLPPHSSQRKRILLKDRIRRPEGVNGSQLKFLTRT